jgi:hypothetical protein
MKFVEPNRFADPDAAARKLVEIANTIEPAQDGRIYIELVNAAFLNAGGTAEQFRAGIQRAVDKGWMVRQRIRDLCEIHGCGSGAVRLTLTANPDGDSLCRRSTM